MMMMIGLEEVLLDVLLFVSNHNDENKQDFLKPNNGLYDEE